MRRIISSTAGRWRPRVVRMKSSLLMASAATRRRNSPPCRRPTPAARCRRLGALQHLQAVLVHADEEVDALALQPAVAGHGVDADLLDGVAHVRRPLA
jgi:hypothetical protein